MRSAAYLRAMLDAAEEGIFTVSSGKVVEYNRRFCDIIGVDGPLPAEEPGIAELFRQCRFLTPSSETTIELLLDTLHHAKTLSVEAEFTCASQITITELTLKEIVLENETFILGSLKDITRCHQLHTRLSEEHNKLHAVIDNIEGVALFIKDRDYHYTLVNRYFTKHIHDAPFKGKLSSYIHPQESADLMQQVDDQVMKSGYAATYEEPIGYKDGTIHHHRTTKIPLKNAEGETEALLGVSVDITEQVEIEKQLIALNKELESRVQERTSALQDAFDALKESEKRYRLMIGTTSEGVWVIDKARRTIEINAALSRILGYTEEEMLGRTPMEFVDEENRKIFLQQTAAIESSDCRSYEIFLTRKDGSQVPTIFHANTIRDDHGEVVMACAFVTDISSRIAAEEKLRAVFNATRDGLAIIDMETNFLDANPAYTAITGYTKEELKQHSCMSLSLPSDRQCTGNMMAQLKAKGYADPFEKQCFSREGEPLYLHMSAAMLDDGEHAVVAIRDMTEIKRYQNELQALNASLQERIDAALEEKAMQEIHLRRQQRLAAMGEMIAMIAHQWRQPLASISATAAALQFKASLERYEKSHFIEQLENISQYSKHLSKTIDDFRHFFKEDKIPTEFSLPEMCDSAIEIIGASLTANNITLEKHYGCEELLYSYVSELKHVILNLLKNAEDVFLEKRIAAPHIIIKSFCDTQNGYIEIEDNGGGIPDAIMEKVFDPYFTTKEKSNGTGLGLYMSKTIIEEHCKGAITVSNTENGARFIISIPKVCHA